ncbi:MAG: hypothetical protein QXW97_03740 [Candidatus Pacearchaeota archaeon]
MKKECNFLKINKKSQITIFIIISIFIIVIALVLFFIKFNNEKKGNIPNAIMPIQTFAEECIKETGEQALFNIGWSGGYISPPINSSTINGIPYYYDKGLYLIPSKERIENEISSYINDMLVYCYYNLQNLSNYQIKQGYIETFTTIENDNVIIKVNSPLVITFKSKIYKLKNFNTKIPVRLGKIYEFAKNITLENSINEEKVCLSCINEKANDMNFYVEITNYDDETIIFTLIDKNANIDGKEFRFNFANKFKN